MAEKHSHIARYMMVFAGLLVLTAITVGIAQFHIAIAAAVIVAMAVAITKGSLVAGYFMHLIGEHKAIFWVLIVTAIFFAMLLFVPVLTLISDYQA